MGKAPKSTALVAALLNTAWAYQDCESFEQTAKTRNDFHLGQIKKLILANTDQVWLESFNSQIAAQCEAKLNPVTKSKTKSCIRRLNNFVIKPSLATETYSAASKTRTSAANSWPKGCIS